MYEHLTQPPLTRRRFLRRLAGQVGYAAAVIVGPSLLVGTAVFDGLCRMGWADALLNAAMLLGGMGPVGDWTHENTGCKLFASFFALYAGLVFLGVTGFILAPVFHRVLHRFHWEAERERASKQPKS